MAGDSSVRSPGRCLRQKPHRASALMERPRRPAILIAPPVPGSLHRPSPLSFYWIEQAFPSTKVYHSTWGMSSGGGKSQGTDYTPSPRIHSPAQKKYEKMYYNVSNRCDSCAARRGPPWDPPQTAHPPRETVHNAKTLLLQGVPAQSAALSILFPTQSSDPKLSLHRLNFPPKRRILLQLTPE